MNGSKKATYVSNRFQNEVDDAIWKIIRKKIVDEVAASKYFTDPADETRDAGKLDQLTICPRYVSRIDSQQVPQEAFLKFFDIADRTGAGRAKTNLDNLQLGGLDVRNLRGQGYDGCSAMIGRHKGVQVEVKAVVPQASYLHCASHCLNLALVHDKLGG